MRLTEFLKRCVSVSMLVCLYDQLHEVDTLSLKKCVSVVVMELHHGVSATNWANSSRLEEKETQLLLRAPEFPMAMFSHLKSFRCYEYYHPKKVPLIMGAVHTI